MTLHIQEERLGHWHYIIDTGRISFDQRIDLYYEEKKEFMLSTDFRNQVKELTDMMVTCFALSMFSNTHLKLVYEREYQSIKAFLEIVYGVDPMVALKKVNDSNFSKLILREEEEKAEAHFLKMGVDVDFYDLDGSYFGAYSRYNQRVNGKDYPKNKLLKGPFYAPVDESLDWWL